MEEAADWEGHLDLPPEDVPAIGHALNLIPIFQALRNLVGQSPTDLVMRAAALHSIQATGKPALSRLELDGTLYYLTETRRENILENLRSGGWVEHSDDGWRMTPLGIDLYNVLLLLFELGNHPYMAFSTLLFHVIKDLQGDPQLSLQGLLNQMTAMTESIHAKIEMRSSVALESEAGRAASAVRMARIAIREADELNDDPANASMVQRLHNSLAHLLNANQRLTEALATVTAAHVSLPAGYTPHEVIISLNRCDPDRLAQVGQEAHLCVVPKRLDIEEATLAASALGYIERERFVIDASIPAEQEPDQGTPFASPTMEHLEELARLIQAYPDEEVPIAQVLTGHPHLVLHRFFALDFLADDESETPLANLGAKLTRSGDEVDSEALRFVTDIKIQKASS